MSNRKNYNSIVFLTTLSVYLGLVLVGGAAPSVLAQAATTRNFDIKNEIVVEDDLDKKPDDDEIEELQKLDLSEPILTLIEDLKKLVSIGKYNSTEAIHVDASYRGFLSDPFYFVERNKWVSAAALDSIDNIFELTKNLSEYDYQEMAAEKSSHQKISLDVNSNGFELKVTLRKDSKEDAALLAGNLTRVFKVKLDQSKTASTKQIYENTKATTENNQVFIVTRLPRASIDALLAEK